MSASSRAIRVAVVAKRSDARNVVPAAQLSKLTWNPPEDDACAAHEIRISPLQLVTERKKPGRPRKTATKREQPNEGGESNLSSNETGIAARVRSRNQSRPRPDYKQSSLRRQRSLAYSSSDSELESDSRSQTRVTQPSRKLMLCYEDDHEYVPPSSIRRQPITVECFFEEKPSSDYPPVQMVVDVSPAVLLDRISDSDEQTVVETSSSRDDITLRPPAPVGEDGSITILPPEDNPSNSESVYSEFEYEAEQTIGPAVLTNETPVKPREEFNGSPKTPDFSNLPPTLQSTPDVPAIVESETMSSPRTPPRKHRKKKSVALGLYETIPPEPILLPPRDDYSVMVNYHLRLMTR